MAQNTQTCTEQKNKFYGGLRKDINMKKLYRLLGLFLSLIVVFCSCFSLLSFADGISRPDFYEEYENPEFTIEYLPSDDQRPKVFIQKSGYSKSEDQKNFYYGMKDFSNTVYLHVGEKCLLEMEFYRSLYWCYENGVAEWYLGDDKITDFTLWRVTDSSVIDFTQEHKEKYPSDYATLPMLKQPIIPQDSYEYNHMLEKGYEVYNDYAFTESDVNNGSETAEVEAKKVGISTVEVTRGEWQLKCPARGSLTVVCYIPGDMDLDEKHTVSDALRVLRAITRLEEVTEEIFTIGDIDGNNILNVADALAILRIAAGL